MAGVLEWCAGVQDSRRRVQQNRPRTQHSYQQGFSRRFENCRTRVYAGQRESSLPVFQVTFLRMDSKRVPESRSRECRTARRSFDDDLCDRSFKQRVTIILHNLPNSVTWASTAPTREDSRSGCFKPLCESLPNRQARSTQPLNSVVRGGLETGVREFTRIIASHRGLSLGDVCPYGLGDGTLVQDQSGAGVRPPEASP